MAVKLAPKEAFINEYTRKLLAIWCDQTLRADAATGTVGLTGTIPAGAEGRFLNSPYTTHALAKGWVNKHGKILAAGWRTAASFMKR